ncbi:hypothetical protein P4E94_09435 [Pontiellaceae bacterium B12219]|nr:hypothetical protein [Pontiellaceae bacterium B12219]
MGLFNLFKPAQTVLVIDAVSLNESSGAKGKLPPRNQLQILRRLARFSQREKIEVVAVLSGTPLNKAPAGKKFEDITVIYSKSIEEHAKFVAKTTLSKGAGAVLVSGDDKAEKLVGGNVKKMRISTFRKAFDIGGDGDGGNSRDNSENGGGRPRGNRPPRRRPQKQNNARNENGGNGGNGGRKEQQAERKPKEVSEADAINELIDLVD